MCNLHNPFRFSDNNSEPFKLESTNTHDRALSLSLSLPPPKLFRMKNIKMHEEIFLTNYVNIWEIF